VKRSALPVIAVALVSMLAGVALYHWLQPGATSRSNGGSQAEIQLHSIPLTDLDGVDKMLGDWRGDYLLVNFWAPWCAPCRREIPGLIAMQDEFAPRGLRILGIAFDNEPQVRRFAAEHGIDYPMFLAAERSAMYNAAFGNRSGSLPFTALIDRNLSIIFRHNGELSPDQLRRQLEKVL
jgi:thiol-disulfide isomerase/thioredoxin